MIWSVYSHLSNTYCQPVLGYVCDMTIYVLFTLYSYRKVSDPVHILLIHFSSTAFQRNWTIPELALWQSFKFNSRKIWISMRSIGSRFCKLNASYRKAFPLAVLSLMASSSLDFTFLSVTLDNSSSSPLYVYSKLYAIFHHTSYSFLL